MEDTNKQARGGLVNVTESDGGASGHINGQRGRACGGYWRVSEEGKL